MGKSVFFYCFPRVPKMPFYLPFMEIWLFISFSPLHKGWPTIHVIYHFSSSHLIYASGFSLSSTDFPGSQFSYQLAPRETRSQLSELFIPTEGKEVTNNSAMHQYIHTFLVVLEILETSPRCWTISQSTKVLVFLLIPA